MEGQPAGTETGTLCSPGAGGSFRLAVGDPPSAGESRLGLDEQQCHDAQARNTAISSVRQFFPGVQLSGGSGLFLFVSRKYHLFLLVDARFDHFHSPAGRGSRYEFGIMEIRNRRYFVQKHHLSLFSYRLAAFLRWCMSLLHGEVQQGSWKHQSTVPLDPHPRSSQRMCAAGNAPSTDGKIAGRQTSHLPAPPVSPTGGSTVGSAEFMPDAAGDHQIPGDVPDDELRPRSRHAPVRPDTPTRRTATSSSALSPG